MPLIFTGATVCDLGSTFLEAEDAATGARVVVKVNREKNAHCGDAHNTRETGMKIPDEELRSALDEMVDSFQQDELAYLAITSKSENPFRDHLAYLLHKRYEADGYIVAREWKPREDLDPEDKKRRIDIAVLSPNGRPICLVQLKMMFAFDALEKTKRYDFEKLTLDDMGFALKYADQQTAVYALLLVAHQNKSFDERYKFIEKYKKIESVLPTYRGR
jgi:hypothetical protein